MRRTARSALLTLFLAATGAHGADKAPPLPPLPPAAPPAYQTLPPYQDRLDRLAELLGVLAFMHGLCDQDNGPDWRGKMADLVEAEGVTEARRARLAGSFNRGFESYRLLYRSCTPAARTVVARSLAEGERLAASLSRLFFAD